MHEIDFSKKQWEDHIPLQSKKIITAVVVNMFSYILSYLVSVVLARTVGAEVYGQYATVVSAMVILGGFLLIGADQGINRFLPEYLKKKNYPSIKGYILYWGKWHVLLSTIIIIFSIVLLIVLYHLVSQNTINVKSIHPVYFFIWAIPLTGLLAYVAKYIRAYGYGSVSLIISNVLRPIFILIILTVVLVFIKKITITEAIFIYIAGELSAILMGALFSFVKINSKDIVDQLPEYDISTWKSTVRDMFILNASISYSVNILILVSSMFSVYTKTTGLIAAAITITAIMWTFNGAIYSALSSKITVAVVEKDKSAIKSVLFQGMAANFIFNGIVLLVIIFLGKFWLSHFGAEFVEAYSLLVIIAVSIFIATLFNPLTWIFQQSNELKACMHFFVIACLSYIVLEILAVHFFGDITLAVVYCLFQVAQSVYMIILAIRNWHNPDFIKQADSVKINA